MNILLYISDIGKSSGGAYQYIMALLNILSQDTENNYFIYSNKENDEIESLCLNVKTFHLIGKEHVSESLTEQRVHRVKGILHRIARKLFPGRRFINYTKIEKLIRKHRIDIIHCPYQVLPTLIVPGITTMHDVQELHLPENFTSGQRAERAYRHKFAIDHASAVIVSYDHIKKDIVNLFSKPEKNVHVVFLDMKHLWFEKYTDKDIKSLENINLPEHFILYPAASWKHKNHIRLLESVKLLKERNVVVNAVFTGHLTDYYQNDLLPKVKELGIEKQIYFLGITDDITLFSLYHKCRAVVVPTAYEAGSFPLMESMMMHIPVICSDVTSLPETIGKKEFTFDHRDSVKMAELIERIYTDEQFRKSNIENSIRESKKFLDNGSLTRIKKIYTSIYEQRNK